jgi:LysM repeat protein
MNVSATATGDAVTLFLYATQQWPSDINNAYWDDASLSIGGAGGAAAGAPGSAPVATVAPPSSVGFVTPQDARDDGSIVHTVQSGDTVDSIAVAYGVTRANIIELNNLVDARIIQIGQQLIVKGAGASAEATPEVESESEGEPAAEDEAGEAPADEAPAEAAAETPVETEGEAPAAAREPTIAIEDAPPAPVISVASGRVLPPMDPAEQDASICVILFDDVNQNRIQEQGEPPLADGVLQLSANGAPQSDGQTDGGDDPFCFTQLVPGDYVVAAGAPSGYGLTTPDQLRVRATAGAVVTVAFGAAQGVAPAAPPPPDEGGLVSEVVAQETDTRAADPLMDNAGLLVFGLAGVVLVAGTGLSLILRRR